MSSATAKSEKMKLAPVRSLNDFLLDTKKYSEPAFSDLKRLNNRVTSNLLYYQTNYFAVSTVIFLLASLFSLGRLLAGAIGITTTVAMALFAADTIQHPAVTRIRTEYPLAIYGAGAIGLLALYLNFRSILFFALVILVPVLLWIVHASLRNRGIKNKVSNKMEQLGAPVYSNTPMSYILGSLGLETRDLEE